MKNPFEKNDHKVLIGGVIVGAVVVGAAAYLFLTETGASVRQQLSGHFNRLRDTFVGGEPEPATEGAPDYLQPKAKKPKTDREALLKHEIIGGGHDDEAQQ